LWHHSRRNKSVEAAVSAAPLNSQAARLPPQEENRRLSRADSEQPIVLYFSFSAFNVPVAL
jgi:hypothetical protein